MILPLLCFFALAYNCNVIKIDKVKTVTRVKYLNANLEEKIFATINIVKGLPNLNGDAVVNSDWELDK